MRATTQTFRPALALALTLAALATARAAAADPPRDVTIENVRVGFGDGLSKNGYKIGTWTPVWVDLKGGPSGFSGVLEFTAPDDSNTPTTIRRDDVVIPPNEIKTYSLYTRPGSRYGELSARVIDRKTGRVKDSWPGNSSGSSLESFGAEMIVVLASGQVPGLTEVKDLFKYGSSNSNGSSSRMIVAPVRARDGFPSRWYGFDSVDVVVLDTNDPKTLERLHDSTAQANALVQWVFQGGHLVVAVGQNWQTVLDGPLGPLLPGVPAGRVELSDPGLFDQFAGATANKPLVPINSKTKLQVTKFEDWEKRGGVPDPAMPSATPLVLRGPYGFGRVTMIGLDVDQKPFSSWDDKKLFWDKLLDLRDRGGDSTGNGRGNAVYMNQSNEVSSLLFGSLQQFPGVRLVPFGWVAFFVFLYILLIGPGDYFFLRKVVKRMEMTWVTFPLIVITVSGAAYAAAYYFKGTELRINKVDAIDVDQTTGSVRGWSWLTLFSPQNRDYGVGFAPLPPDAVAPANPLAATDGPSKSSVNVDVLSSWFGTPDMGGGGGGGMGFGGAYEYAPLSVPEELKGVRVNIWSTKSFTGRWTAPLNVALLESDLAADGPDRLKGTVTNIGRRTLKNSVMFFGRYVYPINEIAPGATVTLGEAQSLIGYMDGLNRGGGGSRQMYYNNGRAQYGQAAGSVDERPDLVRTLMFHRGLGEKAASMPSLAFRSIDLTEQLEMHRPMLVAEFDGPAAQLRLSGHGSAPKITQTTVVRVILPLKSTEAPAAKP